MIGLCATYLLATEFITAKKSKGEILLFRRGHTHTLRPRHHRNYAWDGNLNNLH